METRQPIPISSTWSDLATKDDALAGADVSLLFRGTTPAASAEVIVGGDQPANGRLGIALSDRDELRVNGAALWVTCRGGGVIVPTVL